MAKVNVFICGFDAITSGHKKSFQLDIKVKIVNETNTVVISGSTNKKKILCSEQPSILAASNKSFGILSINCLTKKTPNALTIGKINAG